MTSEEKAKKLDEIYSTAIKELEALYKERGEIVATYIKELENQKVSVIRQSLGLTDNA